MSHRFTVQLEVVPAGPEGPTEWFPPMPREVALMLLDDAIRRIVGNLEHHQKMRRLVSEVTTQPEGEADR